MMGSCISVDVQVWSKLESGRLPSLVEVKELINEPNFEAPTTAQINLEAMPA